MTKVFAKYGTNEKVQQDIPREYVAQFIERLNKNLGGQWLLVDELKSCEIIVFKDDYVYMEFETDRERYLDPEPKKLK